MKSYLLLVAGLSALVVAGCRHATQQDVPKTGSIVQTREVESHITLQEVKFDATHRLWIYKRDNLPAGKYPCIVIAPAGSNLVSGMTLSNEDMTEHLPYAREGYIVVAYDVSGKITDESNTGVVKSIYQFIDAEAGVLDGKRAIDYAVTKIPEVDPNKVFAVGHSSAATLALSLAEQDSRVKACVAFAPVVDVVKFVDSQMPLRKLNSQAHGLTKCLNRNSPLTGSDKLSCPVYLFNADDDTTVPIDDIRQFHEKLLSHNPNAKHITINSGGHYDSMIQNGIRLGMEFLKPLL